VETALQWARGPFFWTAFTFMILGVLRLVIITVLDIRRVMRHAGDKSLPVGQLVRTTLSWLFPVTRFRHRMIYSLSTIIFHVAIIVVPIFLLSHVLLWKRSIGLSWPALSNAAADVLTIIAVVTPLAIVVQRTIFADARRLSRFQDYAIPLVIAVPFASGFLAMHPAMNPFSYEATMLVHVMSANIVFILVPLSKISHCVLLPFTQFVSETAWHFPGDCGTRVAVALGKEKEPV
jgi:nitrate reductase gamma subunit